MFYHLVSWQAVKGFAGREMEQTCEVEGSEGGSEPPRETL